MDWTRIIIDVIVNGIVGLYWYRQGLKDGRNSK